MQAAGRIKVGSVAYGVIGRRSAEPVLVQPNMVLAGVADVAADWRVTRVVKGRTR
ncbi:hypothetical protein [Sphingopyxis chilensis]